MSGCGHAETYTDATGTWCANENCRAPITPSAPEPRESARAKAHAALDAYLNTANARPANQDAVMMAFGNLEQAMDEAVEAEWTEESR